MHHNTCALEIHWLALWTWTVPNDKRCGTHTRYPQIANILLGCLTPPTTTTHRPLNWFWEGTQGIQSVEVVQCDFLASHIRNTYKCMCRPYAARHTCPIDQMYGHNARLICVVWILYRAWLCQDDYLISFWCYHIASDCWATWRNSHLELCKTGW